MSNASPTLIFPNRIPAQAYPPKTIKTPTAIIHTAYSYASPPQKPQDGNWTRFVCVSDTHQRVFPVPTGDVLLHSGDLTNTGQFEGAKITAEWIYQMSHPIKIVIAGNHDLSFHRDWYQTNYYRWHRQKEDSAEILDLFTGTNARESGIVYLEDELYEFETRAGGRKWTVFGSPWTPDFWNWAFNYKRGREADDLVSTFTEADILSGTTS
ncbi:hypothetical protein EWM64_g3437 [Hericium alpestre]|uniref:Calcineurin-like phosphoesterase domain-containing protein n=1 Tax=Hericium alpestre TaxID=135208 RepID=A0A4Z0A2N6_9AGAM|nr:hypothetical protein EWM64_g3437 [Hericium alpestre]